MEQINSRAHSFATNIITLVGTLPPLKGNAYYCMSLADHLSRRLKVDFLSFKHLYPNFLYPGGVTDSDPDFSIAENPSLTIRRIITYFNPISWIIAGLKARGQLVHLQWWSIPVAPVYIVVLFVLWLRKKTIVLTVHNVLPHEPAVLDKVLTRMVLSFGKRYIVHSQENSYTLSRTFGIPLKNISLVHMPVHDMYLDGRIDKEDALRTIGIPPGKKVLLCFGNIRKYKGIDDLLKAFKLILKSEPDSFLLIAGQPWGSWGPYKNLIEKLGLNSNVKAILEYAPTSRVKYYFSAADIVVLPYKKFDAQSGVGNIGISFGKPLVVTKVGGLPELVKDSRALAEPENHFDLARTITQILGDPALEKKLSTDATEIARQYSWDAAINKTLTVYKTLLDVDQP